MSVNATATPEQVVMVRGCARCGQDHKLRFSEFTRPIPSDVPGDPAWRMWALCPVTHEPVLLRAVEAVGA